MQIKLRPLLVTFLSLAIAPSLFAQAPVANLSCQSTQGSSLSVPLFSFNLSVGAHPSNPNEVFYLSQLFVTTDLADYPALLASVQANATYATCTISNGTIGATLTEVAIGQVQLNGNNVSSSTFEVTANFTFTSVSPKSFQASSGR